MKKLILTIVITILLTVFSLNIVSPVYAQTTATQTRNQHFEQLLKLSIPKTTDNPNFVITFKDAAGKGVKLEIDGQGSKDIKSPYTLPSLGIGKHILTFTFTDDQETRQTFDETLIVLPRVPIVQAPEKVSATAITLKGTALAASQVVLYMSSGTKNYQTTVNVADDGTWNYTFTGKFDFGIYNVIGITEMSGYASALSTPLVFELKATGQNTVATVISPVKFSFGQFTQDNIVESIKTNPDLIYFTLIVLFLGFLISAVFNQLINHRNDRKLESVFNNLLNPKDSKNKESKKTEEVISEKKLTLREKLEKAKLEKEGVKVEERTVEVKEVTTKKTQEDSKTKEEEQVETDKIVNEEVKTNDVKEEKETKEEGKEEKREEEESKEEKKVSKKEKVVSKEEFLKLYKEDDPDSEEGKETLKPTEDKKKEESTISNLVKQISVSLTSGNKNKK